MKTPITAREIIAQVLRKPIGAIEQGAALRDLEGWDSLKGVRLVLMIEETIGRSITEAEIESLNSIADVDHLLQTSA